MDNTAILDGIQLIIIGIRYSNVNSAADYAIIMSKIVSIACWNVITYFILEALTRIG